MWDLLVVKPFGKLSLFTHGLREIPVEVDYSQTVIFKPEKHGAVVSLQDSQWGTVTLVHENGYKNQVTFDNFPQDKLVIECFQLIALILPSEITFNLHHLFLQKWSAQAWATTENVEFECFSSSLYAVFGLDFEHQPEPDDPWLRLSASKSHDHFAEDPVFRLLRGPPNIPLARAAANRAPPHPLLAPLLYGLHTLAEHLRLLIPRQQDLLKFAPIVCRIAVAVRPEWADYWKRLIPTTMKSWPSALSASRYFVIDSSNC